MVRLLFNAVSLDIEKDAKLLVGAQDFVADRLTELRAAHRGQYLFKRGGKDGGQILCVALKSNLEPLGTNFKEHDASDSPWLVAPLALEALLTFFSQMGRPVLRSRPLRVLSQRPANLFAEGFGLPGWLQRRIVLDFETRTIVGRDRTSSPVLVCGVRTRNIIDACCSTIIATGLPLLGRYVGTMHANDDPRIASSLRLAGRVAAIQGDELILDDHGDGPSRIVASEAFLEPKMENVRWYVREMVGAQADKVLDATDSAANKHLSGPGRLDLIAKTFDYLRAQPIEIAPGVRLAIGPLFGSERNTWIFRSEVIQKPDLVFDPSGMRTDTWNERGLDKNGPYDQRTFAPKQLRIAVICQAAHEGQVEAFLAKFLDGLPQVRAGFGKFERAPYEKGFIRRFALDVPKVQTFTTRTASPTDYVAACRHAIEAATDGGFEWDLALVQIDQDFKELPGPDNPYFVVKATLLKHRVPVQEITLETMRFPDQQLVFALNNMSLATYAKIGGVPWLLKSQPTVAHELVVGIGSHTISTSRLGSQERVVGITTVFSSDGKYLLDDRTAAVPYERYESALVDSLSRSINSIRQTDNWRSTDAVRLVFHVFKQVKDVEADAVAKLVDGLGLTQVKFAFLHVVDDHPFTTFDENNPGAKYGRELKGAFAPPRGLSVKLSESESLLSFIGSRELKQAHHGIPQPSLLRLHRRSTFRDMTYLTRQVFDFSCHSWRMLTPAPAPITIHYSELIAKLLAGLRDVPAWDADTMLGPMSRTRWFL